jgi:predicted phage terminase large subunit-like protein
MVMPVVYVFDDDYYLVDCICDDSSDYNLQENRLTHMICFHQMQRCEFESNAGGDRLAKNVAEKVKAKEGRCSITTKPTETNKETRIIVNSNWVKEHILFKDKSLYARHSDYGVFMNQLLSYSVSGKNPHDDVPDALANFTLFVTKPVRKAARIFGNFL